jgi:hypothetical protein
MGEDARYTALAAALFVVSFSGVAWIMAGAPVPSMSESFFQPAAGSAKPETRVAAIPAPASQPAAAPVRKPPAIQGEGHPLRDKLRFAALAASDAYAMAPCDQNVKAGMIDAVSAYAKAWRDMMGCGPGGCDYSRLNAAAQAFSTPLDARLREAVASAFDKRGITVDDFPSALRINIAMMARGRGDSTLACRETRAQVVR